MNYRIIEKRMPDGHNFIVQQEKGYSSLRYWFSNPYWEDVCRFKELQGAQQYKHDLELVDGIVIE